MGGLCICRSKKKKRNTGELKELILGARKMKKVQSRFKS